jgi:MGT family glycosyltransferase
VNSAPKRFLFAMWDGGGNVPPQLGVARQLLARGHAVHVLSDPTVEAEARAAGCTFTPWTTAPHRDTRDRSADVIRDYETGSILSLIDKYMGEFLGGPASRWAADTHAALVAQRADALVIDQMIPAGSIAAEALHLPWAALSANIWMIPTPGIPPIGPGFAPARGPVGYVRDVAMRSVMTYLFNKALPPLNEARASYGLPPVRSTYEQILRPNRTFVLTSPRFDFTSPAMPANVSYSGPVLDDPDWSVTWQSPFSPQDGRPLVLVGLSSTYQKQAAALEQIVAALSSLPVRGLVTLGQALSADEVRGTDNVVVVKSAPHSAVLREASVLITHCGHGTAMKGLVAGVPILCMPMGRDQSDTARRVFDRGAGLWLKPSAPAAQIRAAVQRLISEPQFRERAQALGRVIADREGCVDIVTELEQMVYVAGSSPSPV